MSSSTTSAIPKFKYIGGSQDSYQPSNRGLINSANGFNPNTYNSNTPNVPAKFEETYRSQVPAYQNFPKTDHFIPPFSHAMKRPNNNNNKMEEIFGSGQNFNKMKDIPMIHASGYKSNNIMTPEIQQIDTRYSSPANMRYAIYAAIASYFQGFVLTKTRVFGKYSVYKASVKCMLCDGVRFIVSIVANDNSPLGSKKELSSMEWESFQTRYLSSDDEMQTYNVDSFSYARPAKTVLNDNIKLERTAGNSNIYSCKTLPLQIEVIKEKDEFISETGTVSSAIELFSTILTFQT